ASDATNSRRTSAAMRCMAGLLCFETIHASVVLNAVTLPLRGHAATVTHARRAADGLRRDANCSDGRATMLTPSRRGCWLPYARLTTVLAGGVVGSHTTKVAPCPSPTLSARIRPPCAVTISLAMARPSPVP